MPTTDETWARYGSALTGTMGELLEEVPENLRPHLLETADYWISLGLLIGLQHPADAQQLLEVIETEEPERLALAADATAFIEDALQ
jgi:hypothetical protein